MAEDKKTLVLVADDEPSTLALVTGHLRARGYKVIEATDGDQAWELAYEHLPHVVVLDVMMPGMSGWEVCRKIREAVSLAHTGVVMLTGIGENLNEMTSPLYGADAYIDKPFEFRELDAKIRETLASRRGGTLGRPDDADKQAAGDAGSNHAMSNGAAAHVASEPLPEPEPERPSNGKPKAKPLKARAAAKPSRPKAGASVAGTKPNASAPKAKAKPAKAAKTAKAKTKTAKAKTKTAKAKTKTVAKAAKARARAKAKPVAAKARPAKTAKAKARSKANKAPAAKAQATRGKPAAAKAKSKAKAAPARAAVKRPSKTVRPD